MFFCPFWRFLDVFSGHFQAKNTFFRGYFAFLNGMQEKQKGKNNEKSKEKAVGRGSDIFSNSFHSTLKKPFLFQTKGFLMKMQRMYLLPEGREKNTLAPRTVKMMLSQIRSRVLRKSPPLFREKRQVFFIASTRIRKT